MAVDYIGNNDYRGHLNYLAQNGDNVAGALLQIVGNDFGLDTAVAPGTPGTFGNANNSVTYNGNTYSVGDLSKANDAYSANWVQPPSSGQVQGMTTGGTGGGTSAYGFANKNEDVSFLNDQEAQLRDLLGRTDTNLNQGLTQNQDQYDTQVGGANNAKDLQYSNYADQRVQQNQGKQSTYDTINRNAGNGFRSLAQIIGRAAGTGSSAFRDLLPNVIGKDTSSKRRAATETYGQNLAGIDKSQGQYDISFANVLADLLKQKKTNEDTLRSGIEGQKQGILNQIKGVQGQRELAQGGGYAQVKAAQAPTNQAIDNSRNAVESFFNQFRTPYTAQQAVATAPDLAQYNTDRSAVNAGNQGIDPTNPYSALLRKRLQEGSLA